MKDVRLRKEGMRNCAARKGPVAGKATNTHDQLEMGKKLNQGKKKGDPRGGNSVRSLETDEGGGAMRYSAGPFGGISKIDTSMMDRKEGGKERCAGGSTGQPNPKNEVQVKVEVFKREAGKLY